MEDMFHILEDIFLIMEDIFHKMEIKISINGLYLPFLDIKISN